MLSKPNVSRLSSLELLPQGTTLSTAEQVQGHVEIKPRNSWETIPAGRLITTVAGLVSTLAMDITYSLQTEDLGTARD